jgi:hypothetical protein
MISQLVTPDGNVPEMERYIVRSGKVILIIIWTFSGFHWVNILFRGSTFNETHYVTDILGLLTVWRRTQVDETNQKSIVHADNAHPHTVRLMVDFIYRNGMEWNGMKKTLQPLYSPDLPPYDIYLFDHVKKLLPSREFADREEFVQETHAIFWEY